MNTFNIPVIPIPNLVFFPNTSIPLYIEDSPYVEMVKRSIASSEPIALAQAEAMESGHGNLEKVRTSYFPTAICTLGHAVLLEELESGAIKIFVRGQGRIELLKYVQNIPYLICEARYIPDVEETLLYTDGKITRLKSILFKWLDHHVQDSLERENFIKNMPTIYHIVDHTCMFLINDLHLKQRLLENPSLNERINMLNSLLTGHNPLHEDKLVASAFQKYDEIEKTAKLQH